LRKEVRFDMSQDGNEDSAENWGASSTGRGLNGKNNGGASERQHKRALELNKRRPVVLSFE